MGDIDMKQYTMKGTTTVGIKCRDGIVMASDKRATSGNLIVNKKITKMYQISDDIIITMAGTVSDAQLLSKLIKAEIKLLEVRNNRKITVREAANMLAGLVYSNIRKMSMIPGISHFLLGGKDSSGYYIFDIFADGSLTECEDFISSGSGSVMAYGVLETLYKKEISVDEGIDLAVKSINAALQRDNATGNGINVVTITEESIKRVMEKELVLKL